MDSTSFIAWMAYLLALIFTLLLLWRGLHSRINRELVRMLLVSVFALFITPSALDFPGGGEGAYWVPAFMVALMEGINEGFEAAQAPLILILLVMISCLLLSLLLPRACRLLAEKSRA